MFQSLSLCTHLWTLSNNWLKSYWNIHWRWIFSFHFSLLSSNTLPSQMNCLCAFGKVTQYLWTSFINFFYLIWKVQTFKFSSISKTQITSEQGGRYLFPKVLWHINTIQMAPILHASQILYLLCTKSKFKLHLDMRRRAENKS